MASENETRQTVLGELKGFIGQTSEWIFGDYKFSGKEGKNGKFSLILHYKGEEIVNPNIPFCGRSTFFDGRTHGNCYGEKKPESFEELEENVSGGKIYKSNVCVVIDEDNPMKDAYSKLISKLEKVPVEMKTKSGTKTKNYNFVDDNLSDLVIKGSTRCKKTFKKFHDGKGEEIYFPMMRVKKVCDGGNEDVEIRKSDKTGLCYFSGLQMKDSIVKLDIGLRLIKAGSLKLVKYSQGILFAYSPPFEKKEGSKLPVFTGKTSVDSMKKRKRERDEFEETRELKKAKVEDDDSEKVFDEEFM